MAYIIVLILTIIAYQLWKINHLREADLIQKEKDKQANEEKDILAHIFPNIFFEYPEQIKSWYALYSIRNRLDQKQKFYDLYGELPTEDQIDKEILWDAISCSLKKEAKGNILEKLEEADRISFDFEEKASKETRLTDLETFFLLWNLWSERIDVDAGMEIELPQEITLHPKLYQKELEHYLKKYKK